MEYFRRFNLLFATPSFDSEDLEGVRYNQIIQEIERSGFEVVRARNLDDAEIVVQTDAAIGCMMVDWGKKGLEGNRRHILRGVEAGAWTTAIHRSRMTCASGARI